MTTTATIAAFGALGVTSLCGIVVAALETTSPAQEWTVLALLAAVVLGIGGKLVWSVDAQTAALTEFGKQLALVLQADKQARDDEARHRSDLTSKLDRLPQEVASEVRRIP